MTEDEVKNLKLRGGNIAIKRFPLKAKSSIILSPTTLEMDDHVCEVLNTGPGEMFEGADGKPYREEIYVKPGDRAVCWPGYRENEIGKDIYIVDISCIEAIVT